ncbi:MAG: hypothetical protein DMF82_09640 [Acidobacteria bacterium]|nr:MAG: hypothetical protein DMF82_09640 [Acidobacteriota bacterium]
MTMPGMPAKRVEMKKSRHPKASTRRAAGGPASTRGIEKRLESSAYCVAEKRFCVRRSSSTPKAPVPMPLMPSSNATAEYMTRRFGPTWATTA